MSVTPRLGLDPNASSTIDPAGLKLVAFYDAITGQPMALSSAVSAYQLWLNLGNSGTEADFIASLRGPQGQTGSSGVPGTDGAAGGAGQSAYQIWLALGNLGSQADFIASLVGPPGPSGQRGAQFWVGDDPSAYTAQAMPGDHFLYTTTGDILLAGADGGWTFSGNIHGAQGLQGPAGSRGSYIYFGDGPPPNPAPDGWLPGDVYIDKTAGTYYQLGA